MFGHCTGQGDKQRELLTTHNCMDERTDRHAFAILKILSELEHVEMIMIKTLLNPQPQSLCTLISRQNILTNISKYRRRLPVIYTAAPGEVAVFSAERRSFL